MKLVRSMFVWFPLPKIELRSAPRRAGPARVLTGFLGALALLMQLLVPSFSSAAQSDWIEICAEQGPILVQIDSGTGTPVEQDCPKCSSCLLCAVGDAAVDSRAGAVTVPGLLADSGRIRALDVIPARSAPLWPSGRGPPAETVDIILRATRASSAITFKTGGASWT
jgi:DUF2946 family protein